MVMTESGNALVERAPRNTDGTAIKTPTDEELIEFATYEQFLLFCDADEFVDIARSVLRHFGTKAAAALEAGGWLPLRDAPYGEEVVAHMDDGSDLVGAIKQGDGDWWWRGVVWSEDRIEAWRPLVKAA